MSDYGNTQNAERVLTMQETDKKCDACGGTMDFNPEAGDLLCPYCGARKQIPKAANAPERARELDFDSAQRLENCNWGIKTKTVLCKSCGAESVYDSMQISDSCPYCDSNQVMPANDVNTMAPNGVCPFEVTPERAGENFTRWIRKKWFCPSKAKKNARAERFRGVYLPYWTFDSRTSSDYHCEYGITRTKVGSDGKTKTYTKWYSTHGHYDEFIDDQLVCGTDRHDGGILASIEPYNSNESKTYRPEYIAGFIAERYSLGLQNAWEVAKQLIAHRLYANITHKVKAEYGASDVRGLSVSTGHSNVTFKYLLLPIWLSSFSYKSKIYQFMVNGQTGKVGGKTPISALRVLFVIMLGITILLGLLFLGVMFG